MSDQKHFKIFAKNLEEALKQYESDPSKSLLESQRNQIKTLIALESKLRRTLINHTYGPSVYKKFISYICDDKRNILAARPYFRERQSTFTKYISGAIKKRKFKTLFKYKINYTFIAFALKNFDWPKNGKVRKLAVQIEKLRKEITEQNLPLAISQARIFYASTPKSHLSWMDLVQIHCGGLLIAVDKFVPPSTTSMSNEESLQAYRKFRAVAIGRMISDRLEQYSETVIHYYPVDRKKIYRANKIIRTFGDKINYEELAKQVNIGIEQDSQKTNAREIQDLLASASCVSGDTQASGGGNTSTDSGMETTLERYSAPEQQLEQDIENKQALEVIRESVECLSTLEKKILAMKGLLNGNVYDQ
jgi:DNA-directed RNA polymerase specialized sigma subunit